MASTSACHLSPTSTLAACTTGTTVALALNIGRHRLVTRGCAWSPGLLPQRWVTKHVSHAATVSWKSIVVIVLTCPTASVAVRGEVGRVLVADVYRPHKPPAVPGFTSSTQSSSKAARIGDVDSATRPGCAAVVRRKRSVRVDLRDGEPELLGPGVRGLQLFDVGAVPANHAASPAAITSPQKLAAHPARDRLTFKADERHGAL